MRDINRFAPATSSFLEFKDDRDLEIVERIYGDRPLLGDVVESLGGHYNREFDMTNATRLFTPRSRLESDGLLSADDDARDPRVRARLRVAGYVPLYEGKSFWLHDPYFVGRGSTESVSKFMAVATAAAELGSDNWKRPRICMRNVASSTNQRTYIMGVMPPAVHGNSAPTLDGLGWRDLIALNGILTSMVVDYVVRMKVSANLNWFFLETIPVPARDGHAYWTAGPQLVERLNAIGGDFPEVSPDPLVKAPDRLAARLVLDALVADLYDLDAEDLEHIVKRFPIYDGDAGDEHRYPRLAAQVYAAFCAEGLTGAERRAAGLVAARADAGIGLGFDELWQPDGGWRQANLEAAALLQAAGSPA